MTREHVEHVVYSAIAITRTPELFISGPQAILAQCPQATGAVQENTRVEVFTRSLPDAILISDTIGELSAFHSAFGYYAHGLTYEVSWLPDGWHSRLIPLQACSSALTRCACLEVNDIAASVAFFSRPGDLPLVTELFQQHLIDETTVRARLTTSPTRDSYRPFVETFLRSAFNRDDT